MAEKFLLKHVLNAHLVDVMSQKFHSVYSGFDITGFTGYVIPKLADLELKDRAKLISQGLYRSLPNDYSLAIKILIDSMKTPLKKEDDLGRYAELYYMPYAEFISTYGQQHFKESMEANYQLIKVFTAEFSVRIFIENYPSKSMKLLHKWVEDENHHIRRLVSEGTRPRLPWASRLPTFQENPGPVLGLLEKLKADPELYVRRSVANNLNDIAKDHPDLVIETLKSWKANRNQFTDWIVRHASRSLIKSGHKEALILQGFDRNIRVQITCFHANQTVRFGTFLEFKFDLQNTEKHEAPLVVDFVLYFKKANGKLAPKVFKLTEKKLMRNQVLHIKKKHPIKPISTRKYYNGTQCVSIQVNGSEILKQEFELIGV